MPYRTALGKSADVLKNPIKIWEKVDVAEKHRLFYFLFEKRLAYSKEDGYRTANELSSTRLFESFADQNSDDVDSSGNSWNQIIHHLKDWYEFGQLASGVSFQFASI